jgi:hypothetical protein
VPLTNYLDANVCGALDARGPRFGFVPGMRLKFRNTLAYFWPRKCELCEQLALMGLCSAADNDACCRLYRHAPHTQASFSVWQENPLALRFLRTWLADCEDMRVLNRSLAGDQCVSTLLVSAWSRDRGLRVPWIYHRRSGNGRPLKDPNVLFGAYAGRRGPAYLLDTDPECTRGVADARTDCLRGLIIFSRLPPARAAAAAGRVFELSRNQWQEGFGCVHSQHRFRPRPGGEMAWSVAPILPNSLLARPRPRGRWVSRMAYRAV